MKKILIITRCSWTLLNFRHDYIKYILNKKFKITVACDYNSSEIRKLKKIFPLINFKKINFLNQKGSILNEIKICFQIIKLFNNSKFDIIHNFTIRPVVYSTLLSKIFSNSKVINSMTGLGHIFNNRENLFFKFVINYIYLISNHVIFQNKDDIKISIYKFFINKINYSIIFPTIKASIKKIKLNYKRKTFDKKKKIIFLMFCRLIEQKGVREYFKAAKIIKKNYKIKNVEFKLIGDIDLNNPSSLSKYEINSWKKKNILRIYSHTNSIVSEIINSDIVCLPSYGEGMPASLLEALYFGRGIVATNVNGCKEVVKNNYNGYLVQEKNHVSLAKKFLDIINKPYLIKYFGKNSKLHFEKKFSKNPYEKIFKILETV